MSEPSAACCKSNPPPPPSYEHKGRYVQFDGMKTYQTGPSTATNAIFLIYDIFGLYPQTLQGADLLAYSDPAHPFQVFMPDWFGDNPADLSQYPPDTEEKMKYILAFFDGPASTDKTISKIPGIITDIKQKHPEIQNWGIMGYCWGGKIATLVSGEGTTFKAAAQCHPSLMDPKEAKGVTIPMAILPSKDEEQTIIKEFEGNLQHESLVETFSDQEHGWMASKANFNDPRATAEYYRGYGILTAFFAKHVHA